MLAPEQLNIGQSLELFIIGNAGHAVAEPNLGPQIKGNVAAAVGLVTLECLANAPQIGRQGPLDLPQAVRLSPGAASLAKRSFVPGSGAVP